MHTSALNRNVAALLFALAGLISISPRANATSSSAPAATNQLTLRDAAGLALAGSPELRALGFDLRAAESRTLQAGLRPNPVLSLDLEDVLGSGDYEGTRNAQTTLQLSQVIELGGKRRARTQVAGAYQSLRQSEADLARVEVLATVAGQFVQVVGDQHALSLARETTRLAEETLVQAQRRVAGASASPIEEKRARIVLARTRIDQKHAEHALIVAQHTLSALWGATNVSFATAAADLFQRSAIPGFEKLSSRVSRSPGLARLTGEKSLRAAESRLAGARRRPDLTAGAGFRRFSGPDDVGLVFQFSLPLSVSDRQQGAREEARALEAKVEVEQAGTELRLRTVLFGLTQELIHADTELNALEREMLPDAEAALQLAREGFDRARFSQLELLDAQRTLLELRRQRIQAAVAYHQCVIEIEKLLGEPLSSESAQSPKAAQP
jgi:cobalt-zinc-cadmium efflux system outer membrane protein